MIQLVKRIYSYLCLILAMLAVSATCDAAGVTVKAKLDSASLLMGRVTTLHLDVEQDKGIQGYFPLLRHREGEEIIPLCGDSVELHTSYTCDTVDLSPQRIRISYAVPVQSFDSGYYRLPQFVYRFDNDSVASAVLSLKVNPVKVKDNEEIDDYKNVEGPENSSIFDYIPDFIYNYWWIFLILLAAIGVFIYGMRKYRKEGHILPRKPQPSPYEVAISGLRNLKIKKLWERGFEKEYFTELTDILRTYLEGRFGVNAMEMTSKQIMQTLADNGELRDKRDYFRQILSMADFVKFAKVRPLPADNIEAYDNAVKFVEETKPLPLPDDVDKRKGGDS